MEQDKVFKGNTWYQNPFYLIDKLTFATEIEFMGLLPDNNTKTNQKVLISRMDHAGDLLAIAVNSIHKFYCQILFVSIKNQFASAMRIFDFVSAEDNPPFDSQG